MKLLAILATILLCASCATEPPQPKLTRMEQPPIEADIREAVFRHEFWKEPGHDVSAFFLSVGKRGIPSEDFMKRFASHYPPVKPVSRCWSSLRRGVVDKDTGRRGVIFSVGPITWLSDAEVRVSGGWYRGGLASATYVYVLKQKDGKWEVTDKKLVGIS